MHFYALTTLQPHPAAKEHTLNFPYQISDAEAAPFISVMDDCVCLHASSQGEGNPEGGIGIWDWKRATLVTVSMFGCRKAGHVSLHSLNFIGTIS